MTRRRKATRSVRLALLPFMLLACSAPEPAVRPSLILEDDALRVAALVHPNGRTTIEVQTRRPDGDATAITRVDHLRLVLGGGAESAETHRLEFQSCERESEDSLLVRCSDVLDHVAVVRFRLVARGELDVEVLDRVSLRSDVLELTLGYRLLGDGEVEESWAPHLHDEPDELVGDVAFHAPIGYLRRGTTALGLTVDVETLERDRRIAQGLEVRPESANIRHGLICYGFERRADGARFTRAAATGVRLRNESVGFRHRLRVFGDAMPAASLDRLHTELFERRMAAGVGRQSEPLANRSWEQLLEPIFDSASPAAWRDLASNGATAAGCYTSAPVEALADAPTTAWFETQRLGLRTAWANQAFRSRRGPGLDVRAERSANLAIGAPRRAGLVPSSFFVDAEGGHRWQNAPSDGPMPEHIHSVDAACTGYWLMRLSEQLPERRNAIWRATGELARFFLQNQRSSGSIPSFYEAEHLTPRRDVFDDASPECGAAALFLAEYARQTGDRGIARAAERAMQFLGQRDLTAVWPDIETVDPANNRPVEGAEGTLGLIFAARAAFAVADVTGATNLADLGERLCDRLARMQHVWSPNWLDTELAGCLRGTTTDLRLGDPRCALAADAFLRGYAATGRRDLLQRGALALRAGLRTNSDTWTPEGRLLDDSNWGRSTAAAMIEHTRATLGQGVVDVAGSFAQGLDALWFEDLEITANRYSFRLLTEVEGSPAVRICFRGIPDETNTVALTVNGSPAGEWTSDQLAAGVMLQPSSVIRARFTPPATIRSGVPWSPRIRYEGSLQPGTSAYVEYVLRGTPGDPARIELEPGFGGVMQAVGPDVMALEVGSEIEARAVLETPDGRRVELPVDGPRRILVGEMDCIDPGDGDEGATLMARNGSMLRRFVDGREFARAIPAGEHVTYELTVPRTAGEISIRAHVAGPVRIRTGADLLHSDDVSHFDARDVELELSDPRLWREDGRLQLTVESPGPNDTLLAQLLYLASGRTTPLGSTGEVETSRKVDSQIRFVVLPLALADADLRTPRAVIDRVFFGGRDYRRTPPPNPRPTVGSVATLVDRISGGVSELRGTTLGKVTSDVDSATLRDAADGAHAALRTRVTEALGSAPSGANIVVAVCPNEVLPLMPVGATVDVDGRATPLVFVPERSEDGSVLGSGTALLEALGRLYGFDRLGRPEWGNFGQFALSAVGGGHTPSGLAGTNLVRAGWADVVRVDPANHADGEFVLGVAPLDRGRALLRLPCDFLPDRGDLFVECHTPSSSEPWRSSSGALIYWSYEAGEQPIVRTRDGRSCRPRMLRLSPSQPTWRTPFDPATPEDLFRASDRLDGGSTPSIATPRGDVVWAVRRLRTESDGATRIWLEHLAVNALDVLTPEWFAQVGETLTPISPRVAVVEREDTSYVVRSTRGNPGAIVARFGLPDFPAPIRLAGRVESVDGAAARLQVSIGGTTHIDTPIDALGANFELDLPPMRSRSDLELAIVQETDADVACRVVRLHALPLAPAAFPIELFEHAESVRLADGTTYGDTSVVRLDEEGRASFSVPLVTPADRAALQVVAGLGFDGDPATVSIDGRLRGSKRTESVFEQFELTRADEPTPLAVFLAELPSGGDEDGVDLLELEFRGPPGEVVHFVAIGVVRD